MAASNFSSSIPAATSRPYEHEHECEKNHDHGHHKLAPPSTTTVTVSATAVPPSSTASSSVPGFVHIFQTVGSETVITFTSTSLSSSVFTTTSDGHPVTGTTLVVTTAILPTPTNKVSLPAPLKSRSNPLVPVIIGSLVGVLALLGVGIFLYIRRRRRRRSMFHKMSNPLIDIEETVSIQPHQQLVQLETQAQLDAETRTQRGQSVPQKTPRHHDLNHENVLVPTPADNNPDRDRASNVRSQMEEMRTEMRVTMGRMMDHVQRIEAQIESGRDGREGPGDLESVTSDGRPPTYVSSE